MAPMWKLGIVKLISSKFGIRLLAWHHRQHSTQRRNDGQYTCLVNNQSDFVCLKYLVCVKFVLFILLLTRKGKIQFLPCQHYLTLNGWIRALVQIVSQVVMYGFELANCNAYLIASWLYIHMNVFLWEFYLFVENFRGLTVSCSFVNCLVATIHGISWLQYMLINRYLWNPIDSHSSVCSGNSCLVSRLGFVFNWITWSVAISDMFKLW
jgi:hypothetical protein